MVGDKLGLLKLEINKYLGIPYFSNVGKHKNSRENVFVGKGNAKEIALETINLANQSNIKLLDFTNRQIFNFQKKNHLGIDCSGLVYNLLLIIHPEIDNLLIGTEGKKGVRRLSADMLTSAPNARKITDYNSIDTGDLIRMDGGKHVIFIVQKVGNQITYVHSSQKTKVSGVHLSNIIITNPTKSLDFQSWTETTKTGESYSSLVYPKKGDGVYRINI